jgi:hypothetical protein
LNRLPWMITRSRSLFRAVVNTVIRLRVLMVPALYWLVLPWAESFAALKRSLRAAAAFDLLVSAWFCLISLGSPGNLIHKECEP